MTEGQDYLQSLSQKLGVSWPSIAAAAEKAQMMKRRLEEAVAPLAMEDTSVVVFGSLARNEYTSQSDIDWALLVDGQAHPKHMDLVLDIRNLLRDLGHKPPGREGTFGGLASSHDILHKIGGGGDTNQNTTQRILLMLESAAIGSGTAHERVVTQVLKRYIMEDYGILHSSAPYQVPRFLQNDISRYWRTLAVDFAYKRRQRRGEGWALRTAKLRLSRKLTYASGLLACFSCAMDPTLPKVSETEFEADATHPLVEHLVEVVKRPTLQLIASMLLPLPSLHDPARGLFASYDSFLAILDDDAKRDELEDLPPAEAHSNELFAEVRELGHAFQRCLDAIFLQENGTDIYKLTKFYGVF